MQLDQDTAWECFCLFVCLFVFASNTTILRKFVIYSDHQAKEKNGHFQYLVKFSVFISLQVILWLFLFISTLTCPFKRSGLWRGFYHEGSSLSGLGVGESCL